MTTYHLSRAEANEFIQQFGPWNHDVVGRKHLGEDGMALAVEQTRAFTIEAQVPLHELQPWALDEICIF